LELELQQGFLQGKAGAPTGCRPSRDDDPVRQDPAQGWRWR